MVTTKRPGLLACLKHRDYRRLISAFVLSDIGFWAYNVALAVWVFDATGSVTWVAAATICRFVPALVLSAYAGVLADRFEKVRLIVTMDLLFAAIMLVMALVMATDGPVWAVLATAAVSSSLGTAYEPAAAGLTPHVVPERDLASANAFRNTIDNITVIAGPALGAMLLLVGPPQVAVGINAGLFVASALVVRTLRVRSRAVDVTEGGEQGPLQQMLVGIKAILSSQTTALMVGYSVLATLVFGIDTVLFIAVSDELLGTGPDGYGYLLAGLGLGGVLAAPLATRAEARPFLGPIILAGMAAYTLPMLALLWTESPAVGFAVQVVRGAGTLFVDVLAVTALQRTLPNDVMARVFGAFNSLMLASILLGSTVTSAVIATAGVEAAVWVSALGVFAVSLLGLPWLRRMDRLSAARRAELAPRIELLEACDLFEQVGDGDLTQLAGDAEGVGLTWRGRRPRGRPRRRLLRHRVGPAVGLGRHGNPARRPGHGGGRVLRRDRPDRAHPPHGDRHLSDRSTVAPHRRNRVPRGVDHQQALLGDHRQRISAAAAHPSHPRAETRGPEPRRDDMSIQSELMAACASTRGLFSAAACSCALATGDGGELEFVAADGAGADAIIGVRMPVSRGIAGFVALAGQPIAIADVARDERFARDIAESTAYVPTAILAAPLLDDEGETIGVIEVLDAAHSGEESRLGTQRGTAADLAALTVIASQVASMVRLSRLLESTGGVPADPELLAALTELTAAGPDGVRVARETLAALASYARGHR